MSAAALMNGTLTRTITIASLVLATLAFSTLGSTQAMAETSVSIGGEPRDVVISPDGRYAYASQRQTGTVTRIDLTDFSTQVLVSGVGNARAIAVTADNERIVASGGNTLYLIDPDNPSTDDSKVLPTNSIDALAAVGDSVFAIDHEGLELYRLSKTAGVWSSANWTNIWSGVPGQISRFMAVAPDASRLLITIESGSTNNLYLLDDPTTCSPCIPVGITGVDRTLGAAFAPDSSYAYVAVSDTVKKLDLGTNTLVSLDPASVSGNRSRDVGFSSDGSFAYVAYEYNGPSSGPRVQKIDTATGVAVATVTLAPGALPYSIATSPSAGVDLAVLVGAGSGRFYAFPSFPDAPTNLVAVAGDETASISFTPGQDGLSAITNYEYSLDGTTWTALTPADTTSPVTIPGLPNGVAQSIRLRAVNAIGSGPASAAVNVTPVGPPDPPTVTRVDWDDTTASIYFTAPASDGGAPITTYEYTLDSGANWNNRSDGGGTTSPLMVTGLTTNTTYSIDLRAVNSVGGGTTPPAPVVVTPGAPKTPSAPPPTFPPAPPTSVTAVAGDRSAVVTWQAPENAGSFAITHYQVISTPGSHTCLTTTTTCVVDDLESGVDYTFTVRGLNGAGWGAASTPSAELIWPDERATSILVTGGRTVGRLVAFTGTIGGPMPESVRPMIALDGEGSPRMGRVVIPAEDGTFTWSRRLSRGATIWFIAGEATSSPIELAATRRASRR